ncbi:hypothetical protein PVK06_020977 [Gossypium arboreum]|uniref:Uncharacterized protein n=1 Tax=Gossypium arboreum TaxID=29729 RepID=A0ABR0PNS3_GOSAR|nr:hypothetical protein PVK06_020977 [Gossypium arboreum]
MLLEKGFNLGMSDHTGFMVSFWTIVVALNWEVLCDERSIPDAELGQEFYANLTSTNATEVFVQCIKVPVNSKSINDFYDLPDYEDDDYSSILENIETKMLQEIL